MVKPTLLSKKMNLKFIHAKGLKFSPTDKHFYASAPCLGQKPTSPAMRNNLIVKDCVQVQCLQKMLTAVSILALKLVWPTTETQHMQYENVDIKQTWILDVSLRCRVWSDRVDINLRLNRIINTIGLRHAKRSQCPESVSYQKKVGRVWLRPSFFHNSAKRAIHG